jgi:hypothetical protein
VVVVGRKVCFEEGKITFGCASSPPSTPLVLSICAESNNYLYASPKEESKSDRTCPKRPTQRRHPERDMDYPTENYYYEPLLSRQARARQPSAIRALQPLLSVPGMVP